MASRSRSPAEFIDDPDWAGFLPETHEAARRRHLPSHEDCAKLDVEKTAWHLRAGGTLGAMPGYEERQGQLDMLGAIANAYNSRSHLMIEAGTGVGKSLAYLVPSILWAFVNDTPVVVSTATRNLQSQLVTSDIPRALAILGPDAAKFQVALLKGRANYLCLREVSEFFASGYWTMSPEEQAEMPKFIRWIETTADGDLDGYDGALKGMLSCPGEECGGRRCQYHSRCFVYRARKNAASAHLIVVNHALVLAEASSPGAAILPAYSRLVLDEAHNLEDIATKYFSYEFSMPALARIMNRLARKGRGKRTRPGGVLSAVDRQLQKGLLAGNPSGETARRISLAITSQTVRLANAADAVLKCVESELFEGRKRDVVRYRKAPDTLDLQSRMDDEIVKTVNLLRDLRDTLDGATPEGEINFFSDLTAQLNGIADSFIGFANEANFVLRAERDTHAYWAEFVRAEKRHAYLRLVGAPLSVAGDLKKYVYDLKDSVILSSATLRVGNDFRYMAARLGCSERFEALAAASPFDYFRQSLTLAADFLPDPGDGGYVGKLAQLLKDLAAGGRTLVLFTSYEMMRAAADALAGKLPGLLVQGEGLSREAMTAALKRSPADTVVFGAQSFWEGVDVAGDALERVVITRLPFAQVGDPIVEARSEKVDREGGSSFRDYVLPEAVIKFRQGFGRLIRSKRDRGVVIVTDPRLVTKNYGAVFRRSIPASVHTVTTAEELLGRIAGFMA
ncbi:MAG: hypothetical protein ILO34_01075 [Kiritimatiellae bacterium]|nr:hypothetical protein [Kiritimatiellia bacterium]